MPLNFAVLVFFVFFLGSFILTNSRDLIIYKTYAVKGDDCLYAMVDCGPVSNTAHVELLF